MVGGLSGGWAEGVPCSLATVMQVYHTWSGDAGIYVHGLW